MYLMQLISRMIDLGYTTQEIEMHMTDIQEGFVGLEELIDALILEEPIDSVFLRTRMQIEQGKWNYVLKVIQLRGA